MGFSWSSVGFSERVALQIQRIHCKSLREWYGILNEFVRGQRGWVVSHFRRIAFDSQRIQSTSVGGWFCRFREYSANP